MTLKGHRWGIQAWRKRAEAAYGMLATPLDFAFDTFTAGMAKRGGTGVFAAAPMIQDTATVLGTPDVLSMARGTLFGNPTDYAYSNLDPYQGSIVLWWTPEYDSGGIATGSHYILYDSANFALRYDYTNSRYTFTTGGQSMNVASAVVAGTAVLLSFSWSCNNTLDGTNYARVGINDTHTFSITTAPTPWNVAATLYIGSSGTGGGLSGLVEGQTIYRRVLYDGTYGVPFTFDSGGPMDELAAIYAAGAGADPCLTTGSWDVVFCLPTDSTEEALVTGTGEAWSHPHGSDVLDHWTLEDGFYGGGQWAVDFNATTTSINCGSAAALDDLPSGATLTVDAWVRLDASSTGTYVVAEKGSLTGNTGWCLQVNSSDLINFVVQLATTDASAVSTRTVRDGKWHHVVGYYIDGTKTARVAVDGAWGSANVGAGAYQADAAVNLNIGRRTAGTNYFDGAIGWVRISDNDRHTAGTDFIPPREFPAADGNTVEAWSVADGTGATAAAQVTSPGNDGTITSGTWEQQWDDVDTPVYPTVLEFDTTTVNFGSAADIDDLHDNAMTVELWINVGETDLGIARTLMSKAAADASTGWYMRLHPSYGVWSYINCATTDAYSRSTSAVDISDGKWHHVAFTWDDAASNYPNTWTNA